MSQSRFSRRTRKSPSPQDNPSPAVPWLRRRWLLGGVGSILVIVMTGMLLYYPPWSNGVERQNRAGRDEFASERTTGTAERAPFDGNRAIGYLENLCKIGARISGTDG